MNTPTQNQLKRSLNLPLLTLYGLGTILGAGIYVLVGKVAGIAGIYAPVAFFVSAFLAAFTGYSYAKLCTRFPKSAGEALYVRNAFNSSKLAALVGWLVVSTGVVSSATLTRGFIGYFDIFVSLPEYLAIIFVLLCLTLLACWGIAESVTIASIVTLIELFGVLLVIWVLRDSLAPVNTNYQDFIPPPDFDIWLSIFIGAFLAFYAFIGFEDMVNVVEETKAPEKNMPLAIFAAVGISSALYFLVALIAVSSMPVEELNKTDAPMAALLALKSDKLASIISLISIIAIINGVLVQMIMGSRILYGMSNQGIAPAMFSNVNSVTKTPVTATIFIALIIWFFASILPLVTLAKITSFIVIVIFLLVNSSLATIIIREKENYHKPLLPLIISCTGAITCTLMLVLQLYIVFTGDITVSH